MWVEYTTIFLLEFIILPVKSYGLVIFAITCLVSPLFNLIVTVCKGSFSKSASGAVGIISIIVLSSKATIVIAE